MRILTLNCSTCNSSYDNQIEYLCPSCGGYENINLFLDVQNYIKFLKKLNNKTATLIDKLNNKGILITDVRREKLGAFNIITLATIYDLADYDNDIRYDDSRIPKTLKESNPKLDYDSIKRIIENIDLRNKYAYLVISLFLFEQLFTELAKNMGFTGKKTYWNVVNHIIDNLDLKDQTEKRDSLILPSFVRNALHSGGIHIGYKNQDTEMVVKNITFKFEHGKGIQYNSWREIIFYFNNIIEIIEEILDKENS